MPCDNISKKNGSYCELTAMYWAWKNIKKIYPDLEYIGLNHYRRYFDLKKNSFVKPLFKREESEIKNYTLDLESLEKLLLDDYTIVSKPTIYTYPLAFDYAMNHILDDLKIFAKIALTYNANCEKFIKEHLLYNNKLSHFNMFIMKWERFDQYCNWLFKSLEETEKYVNIDNYSAVQKRIYGYLAERLLNVFCQSYKLKTKFVPVIQYVNQQDFSSLFYFLQSIRFNITNCFIRPQKKNLDFAWNTMMRDAETLTKNKI